MSTLVGYHGYLAFEMQGIPSHFYGDVEERWQRFVTRELDDPDLRVIVNPKTGGVVLLQATPGQRCKIADCWMNGWTPLPVSIPPNKPVAYLPRIIENLHIMRRWQEQLKPGEDLYDMLERRDKEQEAEALAAAQDAHHVKAEEFLETWVKDPVSSVGGMNPDGKAVTHRDPQ